MSSWYPVTASKLTGTDLLRTLCGGQCFRWFRTRRGTYIGVLQNRAFELRETPNSTLLYFRRLNVTANRYSGVEKGRDEELLAHFLSLDVNVSALWKTWTTNNQHRDHPLVRYLLLPECQSPGVVAAAAATPTAQTFPMRHLRQDVHETLFEFLCSQNNHVTRITDMVNSLASLYGKPLCAVHKESGDVIQSAAPAKRSRNLSTSAEEKWTTLYSFPTIKELQKATEEDLRSRGFGYRSKYITATVDTITKYRNSGSSSAVVVPSASAQLQHAQSLTVPFYHALVAQAATVDKQREMLVKLPGVGRKVADCVLLFSLGRSEIVPVDTHMAQIAAEYLVCPVNPSSTAKAKKGTGGVRKRSRAEMEEQPWQDELKECEKVVARWLGKQKSKTPAKSREVKKKLPPLNDAEHDAIQKCFVLLFGPYCGWAHSVLFYNRMRKPAED